VPRRRRSFFFDNISKRLLLDTVKTPKESKVEVLRGSVTATDVLKKEQIDSDIDASLANLVNTAPEALNTLDELAAALGDDANFATTTATSLGNRLRIDTNAQSLTSTQKTNAVTNLGLATVATSGAYSDLTGTPTIPTNNNQLTNGAGYITSADGGDADTVDGIQGNRIVYATTGSLGTTNTNTSDGGVGSNNIARTMFFRDNGSNFGTIGFHASHATNSGYAWQMASTSYTDASEIQARVKNNGTWTSAVTIWNSGNDGSGSGLDADTVDGIQGSSIMRLDASGTVPDGVIHTYECYGNIATSSGNQASLQCFNNGAGTDAFMTFHVGGDYAANLGVDGGINDLAYGGWSAGANSYRVYHAGNTPSQTITVAGIGRNSHQTGHLVGSYNSVGANSYKSNPIYTIGSSYNPSEEALGNMYGIGYSHNNASFISLTGAGGWGMYVAADGDARVWLDGSSGNISGTGNVTAYASDGRLKTNVTPIENAIDKVKKIRGVTFDWIDNITSEYDFHPSSMHETGVIAQEIQEVIPDAVVTAPFNGNYARKSGVDHNFLTVDKDKIIPLLIEAIKEQQQQIEELKEMISGTSN
jgi:hypothetical protein